MENINAIAKCQLHDFNLQKNIFKSEYEKWYKSYPSIPKAELNSFHAKILSATQFMQKIKILYEYQAETECFFDVLKTFNGNNSAIVRFGKISVVVPIVLITITATEKMYETPLSSLSYQERVGLIPCSSLLELITSELETKNNIVEISKAIESLENGTHPLIVAITAEIKKLKSSRKSIETIETNALQSLALAERQKLVVIKKNKSDALDAIRLELILSGKSLFKVECSVGASANSGPYNVCNKLNYFDEIFEELLLSSGHKMDEYSSIENVLISNDIDSKELFSFEREAKFFKTSRTVCSASNFKELTQRSNLIHGNDIAVLIRDGENVSMGWFPDVEMNTPNISSQLKIYIDAMGRNSANIDWDDHKPVDSQIKVLESTEVDYMKHLTNIKMASAICKEVVSSRNFVLAPKSLSPSEIEAVKIHLKLKKGVTSITYSAGDVDHCKPPRNRTPMNYFLPVRTTYIPAEIIFEDGQIVIAPIPVPYAPIIRVALTNSSDLIIVKDAPFVFWKKVFDLTTIDKDFIENLERAIELVLESEVKDLIELGKANMDIIPNIIIKFRNWKVENWSTETINTNPTTIKKFKKYCKSQGWI